MRLESRGFDAAALTSVKSDGLHVVVQWRAQAKQVVESCPPENDTSALAPFI
jgi:hypothetical protein